MIFEQVRGKHYWRLINMYHPEAELTATSSIEEVVKGFKALLLRNHPNNTAQLSSTDRAFGETLYQICIFARQRLNATKKLHEVIDYEEAFGVRM